MKLTAILMLCACLQLAAKSNGQLVTLSLKNAPIKVVFREIQKQTGMNVLVNEKIISQAGKVTMQVVNMPVDQVLSLCFKNDDIHFVIVEGTIVVAQKESGVLLPEETKAQPPPIDVKGRIVDGAGEPIAGASIQVKGNLSVGTNTDEQGYFELTELDEKATLVISGVNFEKLEIFINGRTALGEIVVKLKVLEQEEFVVNAGYYKINNKERTGSIAKVTAEDIENQPVTNVLSAVQGRMAGVSIVQSSGVPGGGYEIQIRGRNSLRNRTISEIDGNQPLYVIDGVPVGSETTASQSGVIIPGGRLNPLNSVNPRDIESIEILKDADATAIYGSRGANGVVLITTRKGKIGKVELSYNTSFVTSKVLNNLKMMNTDQYINMRKQAFVNSGITSYPPNAYDINGTWDLNRNTNWPAELIGNNAYGYNNHLSLSGGSETAKFLVGIGHNEQSTVFGQNFKYKTTNFTNSIVHRSKDNRLVLNVSNLFSVQNNNLIRSDITRQAYLLAPNSPALYNDDGSLNWENNTFTNPVVAYNSTYSYENKQLLNNINSQYELFKGFKILLNAGIDYRLFDQLSLQPNTMYDPSSALGRSSANSRASKANQNKFSFILEPQANWKYKKGQHLLDILVGGTYQQEKNNQNTLTGLGFESNVFITNIGAAKTKQITETSAEYKYAAAFGRLNYQYDQKYILNITGRRDGSSRFGPNKKFANFGAVGAAWLFSRETFLENIPWISFGKIRTSYGVAGSDNIGDYQYLETYALSFSYDGITGLLPSRLYNPDYSWEKTIKAEAAFELGLFKDKINLSLAWYRNRSSNQLVGYQLPTITGFTSILANLPAVVQNSGFEIELNAHPFATSSLKWESAINLSFPRSKLVSFPDLAGSTYANRYVVGQPVNILKLYQLEGIDPQTGLYKIRDFNQDGKISSPDDKQVIEQIGIKLFGGWTNSVRYKNWNLSSLFQFVKQKERNFHSTMANPGGMTNQPKEVLDVWSADNPNGKYMPYKIANTQSQIQFTESNAIVSDASFIRLKNIQLGYVFPLKGKFIKDLNVYFQGQNLLTMTKYFGADPEFLFLGYLPPLRSFSLGLQINF